MQFNKKLNKKKTLLIVEIKLRSKTQTINIILYYIKIRIKLNNIFY